MVLAPSLAADVARIGRITQVPTILQVVARATGLRFAAVARVTDTSWTACAVYDDLSFGLKAGEGLVLESTICNEIRQHHRPVIIDHVSESKEFCDHHTPKMYGFESYISMPIFKRDGTFFGTLCALDPRPAKLDDERTRSMFGLFTDLISQQIDGEERLERSANALTDAEDTARLRDQFIAVLGHDLRQPLNSIHIGVSALARDAKAEGDAPIFQRMQRSVARMTEMTQNILDFAHGRLAGGIPVASHADDRLAHEIEHVIGEIVAVHPDRAITANIAIGAPVVSDVSRISQLLANLLGNAVAHGAHDRPIVVDARTDGDAFHLAVTNGGASIAREDLPRLFRPFTRTAGSARRPGLGLGLYIASEIAKAHGGTLEVESNDAETRFVFRMPRNNPPTLP